MLELVQELIELCLPDLRICVTSRPEIDIRDVLAPLTSLILSLHDQCGQKKDIVEYVKSVVYSNSEPIMRRWRAEDKELVVKVLSERADGMEVGHLTFVMLVLIIKQVPVGVLSVGNSAALSSIECPAYPL